MTMGLNLEKYLADYLSKTFQIEKGTKKEDEEQGTDIWLEGYRCDITFNHDKDHVEYHSHYDIPSGITGQWLNLDFGVRNANNHHKFDELVMVIKISADDYKFFERELDICAEAVARQAQIIKNELNRFDEIIWAL